uniref:Uncharacterized protein n=1 Tax=Anguilla anguilla TaxID=7936 RepID=A0A0E9PS77_ANGAN
MRYKMTVKVYVTHTFFQGGVVNPMPNPQPGGPRTGSSASSPLTCPVWLNLPGL